MRADIGPKFCFDLPVIWLCGTGQTCTSRSVDVDNIRSVIGHIQQDACSTFRQRLVSCNQYRTAVPVSTFVDLWIMTSQQRRLANAICSMNHVEPAVQDVPKIDMHLVGTVIIACWNYFSQIIHKRSLCKDVAIYNK